MPQDKTLRLEQMLSERDTKIEQLANQLKSASAQPASAPDQDPARDPEEAHKQGTSALDGMSHLKLEFQVHCHSPFPMQPFAATKENTCLTGICVLDGMSRLKLEFQVCCQSSYKCCCNTLQGEVAVLNHPTHGCIWCGVPISPGGYAPLPAGV